MALVSLARPSGLLVWIAGLRRGIVARRGAAGRARGHAARPFRHAATLAPLRWLLTLDFLLVTPVGLTMYLAPTVARRFWPWDLAAINVRLIGSIFVATMIISFWGCASAPEEIRPSIATGGAFATLALIASLLHFGLFDSGRPITWVFVRTLRLSSRSAPGWS